MVMKDWRCLVSIEYKAMTFEGTYLRGFSLYGYEIWWILAHGGHLMHFRDKVQPNIDSG